MNKIYHLFIATLLLLCNVYMLYADAPAYENVIRENQYDVNFYFLNLNIEANYALSGYVQTKATVVASTMDTMSFELDGFTVDSAMVSINGGAFKTVTVARTGTDLDLLLTSAAHQNDMVQSRVYYHGTAGTSPGYPVGYGVFSGPPVFSASPPYNSDTWWPCKQVLADKADSSWFFITTSDTNIAVAAGLLTDTISNGAKKQWQWKTHYPINFYLISFCVGNLTVAEKYFHPAGRTDSMPVILYSGGSDPTTPMTFYSKKICLYPFYGEKLGVARVGLSGGMENQTIICLGPFGSVIAHETMHQWFGDNVSIASFRDLALSEGFARWAEGFINENTSGNINNTRISYATGWETTVLKYAAGSVYNHSSDTSGIDMYTDAGYDMYYTKGAMVINSMRGEINNDSLFFLGLHNYQIQMGGKAAYGTDLRDIMSASTGVPLTDFFNCWYYGYGYPAFGARWKQAKGRLQMEITETTSDTAYTPLFKNWLEVKATRLNGGVENDTIIRVYISKNVMDFNVSCGDSVTGLVFDPNEWIANKVAAVKKDSTLDIPCIISNVNPIIEQGDTLVAPVAVSYQWYHDTLALDGDTLQQFIAAHAGNYSVSITDNSGCTADTSIIYACKFTPGAIVRSTDTLTAPVSLSYQWYLENVLLGGDTLQQLVVSAAGNYSVQLANTNGCTGAASINYSCTLQTGNILQQGDTLTAPVSASYQWYRNGSPLINDTLQQLVADSNGQYSASVTGTNGCTGVTDTVSVIRAGLDNMGAETNITIYPNPNAVGSWQLSVGNSLVGSELVVYDEQGRVVFKSAIRNLQSEIRPDVPAGIYFIEISAPDGIVRKKLVRL